jgi:hypothetical protein
MKPVSNIGKLMVERIFQKQRVLVHMGTKLLNVQHGLVEI